MVDGGMGGMVLVDGGMVAWRCSKPGSVAPGLAPLFFHTNYPISGPISGLRFGQNPCMLKACACMDHQSRMRTPFLPESLSSKGPQRRPLKAAATLQSMIMPLLRDLFRHHPLYKQQQIDWGQVQLSPDLRVATISVAVPPEAKNQLPQVLAALKPLAFVLQKKIAPHVTGKSVPRIRFVADQRMGRGDSVEQLLMAVQKDWLT